MTAITLLWAWQAWRDRALDAQAAEVLVSHLARSAEAQVEGALRAIEAFLLEAAIRIDPKHWPSDDLQHWFAARLQGVPEITSVVVLDSHLQVIGDPIGRQGQRLPGRSIDLSARPYVRQALDRFPEQAVTIGPPTVSPFTGEMVIPIAIAIPGQDGKPAGMVIGGVDPLAFERALASVVIEEKGGAALFTEDAVFLTRVPRHAEFVGRTFASNPLTKEMLAETPKGVRHFVSPADGYDKVVAYRSLDRYPVMVTVGLTKETALARWRQKIVADGSLLMLLVLTVMLLAYLYDKRSTANALLTRQTAEAKELAENLLKERSSFFAAASHDLRQPVHTLRLLMTAIQGELGDRRDRDADLAELVEQADNSVTAMAGFLDAFLDITRMDNGSFTPNLRRVSMADLLQTLQAEFERVAACADVRLEVVPSSLAIVTDPDLLHRALANLVGNAIKFSGDRVLVGCRRRGDQVEIMVCDNGPGIDEEHHQAIFSEFTQLGNSARQRNKGVGLGLASVKRITTLLGNDISVRSTPGKGSCFSLSVRRDAYNSRV